MLKKILIGAVVVIVAFLGFVATRPDTYHVERSLAVQAPPEVVHSIVGDMARFSSFSPWHKLDPNMKVTLSEKTTGVGASYAWDSTIDDAGAGKMTFTEVKPNERVVEDLHFMRPFESKASVTYTTMPEGTGTKITWAMDGNNGFLGKLMGIFMNMDAMIGPDFEEGLQNLSRVSLEEAKAQAEKTAAEAAAAAVATPPSPGDPPGSPAAPAGKG